MSLPNKRHKGKGGIPLLALAGASLLLSVAGCSGDKADSTKGEWGSIAVSTAPQGWLADRLSSDSLHVTVLLPPGSDPETTEPSLEDLKELAGTSVWFWLDTPGYEQRIRESAVSSFPDLEIVDCTTGISKIRGTHGHSHRGETEPADPHYFSSVRNAEAIAVAMERRLASLYPEHAPTLARNLDRLRGELRELDDSIATMTGRSTRKAFVTEHPSLSYFARDYGLRQISLTAEGKEATPDEFADLLERGRRENAAVMFYEKGHSPKGALQAASELGLPAVETDLNSEGWRESLLRMGRAMENKTE